MEKSFLRGSEVKSAVFSVLAARQVLGLQSANDLTKLDHISFSTQTQLSHKQLQRLKIV